MEYIMGGTIVRAITLNLTLSCLNRITSSAQSIYTLIGFVNNTSKGSTISDTLNKLDLDLKIKVIESILSNLRDEKHSETLSLCITALDECLKQIENELTSVYTKAYYNKSIKLFKSYRSYNFDDNIKNLTIYSQTLDSRKILLFELLNIDKHLYSEQSVVLNKKKTYGHNGLSLTDDGNYMVIEKSQ